MATEAQIEKEHAVSAETGRKIAAWNREHHPGCVVLVWQSLPAGKWIVTQTTTHAFPYQRRAAVHVAFASQPIFLGNLSPVSGDIVDRLELQIPRRRPDGKELAVKG